MRLTLEDDYQTAVKKLSESPEGSGRFNPGAASVMMQCYQKDFFIGQLVVAALDEKEIYGPNIWLEYKDVCGENLDKFIDSLDPTIKDSAKRLGEAFKS